MLHFASFLGILSREAADPGGLDLFQLIHDAIRLLDAPASAGFGLLAIRAHRGYPFFAKSILNEFNDGHLPVIKGLMGQKHRCFLYPFKTTKDDPRLTRAYLVAVVFIFKCTILQGFMDLG